MIKWIQGSLTISVEMSSLCTFLYSDKLIKDFEIIWSFKFGFQSIELQRNVLALFHPPIIPNVHFINFSASQHCVCKDFSVLCPNNQLLWSIRMSSGYENTGEHTHWYRFSPFTIDIKSLENCTTPSEPSWKNKQS